MASGGMKFVQTGPARTADMQDNEFRMYSAEVKNGKWDYNLLPIPMESKDHIAAPALSPDSQTLLYIIYRLNPYKTEIYSSGFANGQWSAGKILPYPVNSKIACESDNASLAGKLQGSGVLFIETKRKDPEATKCGEKPEIYKINIAADGSYSVPLRLNSVNGNKDGDKDTQPHIMPDESQLYWSGIRGEQGVYGIFTADYVSGDYVNPRPIIRITDYLPPLSGKPVLIGEPNVAKVKQGLVMYFVCGFALDDKVENRNLKVCFSRKPN
jgi:hypothetical protein